jgi:putative ABC transport system permease protein
MEAIARDIRLALRSLLAAPGLAVVAIVTLAIGLGAATLMYSAANVAFFQPLPFKSDGLAYLWQVNPIRQAAAPASPGRVRIPGQVWRDWQEGTRSFSSLAATNISVATNVSDGADAERLLVTPVSRNFFETLGVGPALGRGFSVEEATPNGPFAIVISDATWERFFGRSPDALGRSLRVAGVSVPVIGVMPPGFDFPDETDLWATFEGLPTANTSRTAHNFQVIGRLAPGVTMRQAQAELETVTAALHVIDPVMRDEGYGVRVADLRADLLGDSSRALLLLTAGVACLLLIAVTNVTNLLLARAVSRQTQTTLRVALGASRRDVLRLFIAEALALAVCGGALGALLLFWSGTLIEGLVPAVLRPSGALRPDFRVFMVMAALTAAATAICALLPARYATRLHLRTALVTGAHNIASEPRAMRVMVGLQVALGVILLTGAGLLAGSLLRLERVDPGFRRDGALVASVALGGAAGSPYQAAGTRAQFWDRLIESAGAMPGVSAAGVTSSFPFAFSPNALLQEDGVPLGQWGQAPATEYRVIGGAYFEAMGTPVVRGRLFTGADRAGAPPVAIVNEATVRILWNGEDALGRRVRMYNMDGVEEYATVVGVVADTRHRGLTNPAVSEVYFPYPQRPVRTFAMTLVAATAGDPAALAGPLRSAVRDIDPGIPVSSMPINERLDAILSAARFRTGLFSGFAVTALVLAAFGIFGVVSYSIETRMREMGIRAALGARAAHIRRLVLWRALGPVLAGLMAGGTVAMFASRLLSTLLFEVERADPMAYAVAGGLLLAAAMAAAWWPAHRASRADPLTTLRSL